MKNEKAIEMAENLKISLISITEQIKNGKRTKSKLAYLGINDFADIIKYCDMISTQQFRKAQIIQTSMDTSVYEALPDALWEYIEYGTFK